MLATKENMYHLSLISPIGKNKKRDITQSILYGIYSYHPHLEHKLCAKYHDPSSNKFAEFACLFIISKIELPAVIS